jgi:catechol 2,3-dioxygenase
MDVSRCHFIALAGATAYKGITMGSETSPEINSRQVEALNAPLYPGAPTLIVRDLSRVASYYEDCIGLSRIDEDSDTVRLGAGGVALMVLRERQDAEQEPPSLAGLYHTAFLVPSRADLGVWLRRAIDAKLPFDGAADHLVSESLYLSDPEGNGIEIYADRPRSGWKWRDKIVEMRNSVLDTRGILADGATVAKASSRLPDATRVGHVHLRVGGVAEAEQFYGQLLGFDITRRREGATFYATGRYHHHLATNIWKSRGSPRRPGTTTGLAILALIAKDGAAFDATAERMLAAGGKQRGSAMAAEDPWGNVVELSKL